MEVDDVVVSKNIICVDIFFIQADLQTFFRLHPDYPTQLLRTK